MTVPLEQVADSLLRAGLLTDEELDSACHDLQKESTNVDSDTLLAYLTANGKLTSYQAKRVKKGESGSLVLGNYVVLSHIGEGGMGSVFKALHRVMDRIVAIKVIRRDVVTPDFAARFLREIRAAARLNHPNVVVAYDADECELGQFLVMEYVEGTDLDLVIEKSGPLSVDEAINTTRQAALALEYAHGQGVIHRDIKPANLMRDIKGTVKVADLGLARLQSSGESTASTGLTQQGMVAGTVDYMPPEQASDSHGADHRADIYSLGCTLFFLLTGVPVFRGNNLMARLLAHREKAPPPLAGMVDGVTPELDAVFQKMVAKHPDDRYQSMDEVAAALDALGQPTRTTDSKPDETDSLQDLSVLLVEKSKLQAGMIAKRFKELDVGDVLTCTSGVEAMERLAVARVDLLATSIVLPDMSGLELAEHVRDELRWSQLGVLLMTSEELSPEIQTAVLRLGAVAALQKPFDVAQLRDAIGSVLIEREATDQRFTGFERLRVLVTDDSSVARRHMMKTLASFGMEEFTQAEDGAEAAKLLGEATYDLIVTDYNMPNMDGRELVAHIRQESTHPNVPIVMVTTEFDPAKLAPVYQLGVSAICNKSFDPDLVRNILIQLFA